METHFFVKCPPPPLTENRAVYAIIWKNIVEPDRSQMTVWYEAENMRFACRVVVVKIARVSIADLDDQVCSIVFPLRFKRLKTLPHL